MNRSKLRRCVVDQFLSLVPVRDFIDGRMDYTEYALAIDGVIPNVVGRPLRKFVQLELGLHGIMFFNGGLLLLLELIQAEIWMIKSLPGES
ncbi:hypothetical protein VNO77_03833 [Canavalia gladiata]|uniref:Uncharacterized protein n=1 Tax=Canavalia gladiata TaxID=3824 RepID=A0AAN9MXG9_CANGL